MGKFHGSMVTNVRLVASHIAMGGSTSGDNIGAYLGWDQGRASGEVIGRIVEACMLYLIDNSRSLLPERFLTYNEVHTVKGNTVGMREIDGIHRVAAGKAVVYECKLAGPNRYSELPGLDQLRKTVNILRNGGLYTHLPMRLVYVVPANGTIPTIPGVPVVSPEDVTTPLGILWLKTSHIEAAAKELYYVLPTDWNSTKGRQGTFDCPIEWH